MWEEQPIKEKNTLPMLRKTSTTHELGHREKVERRLKRAQGRRLVQARPDPAAKLQNLH